MHRLVLTMLACLTATACTNGPQLILHSHIDYNKAVRQVKDEELLLNIVRMRYAEAPQFVTVSGITTQFTTVTGLESNVGWADGVTGPAAWGVNGSLSFTDTPTITLEPRQGEEMARQMLGSIHIADIAYLANAGYRLDHLLVLLAENINGVRSFDVGGSLPSRGGHAAFADLIVAVDALARRDEIVCGFLKAYDNYQGVVAQNTLRPADYLAAIQSGKRWKALDDGSGGWSLHTYDLEPVIWISPKGRASSEGRRVIELLKLEPDAPFYWLSNAKYQSQPEALTDTIRIRMRSFYGVMNFLAHAVQLPPGDMDEGRAITNHPAPGSLAKMFEEQLSKILHIRESQSLPEDAWVAVRHRGYWFYIDDRDLPSKRAFTMAAELLNLEVSNGGTSTASPVLTLPLG